MRKSWVLKTAAAVTTALLFVGAPMALNTEKASAATERDFPCTYSASEPNQYVYYGSSEVITYTAAEAEAAGVPAGYENEVVKVVSTGHHPERFPCIKNSKKEVSKDSLKWKFVEKYSKLFNLGDTVEFYCVKKRNCNN